MTPTSMSTRPPDPPGTAWHLLAAPEAARELGSDPTRGLAAAAAAARLETHGPNQLQDSGGRTPWGILFEQLRATMVLVLLAAGVLAAVLGDVKNTIAIGAIVVLFVLLGTFQEYRAEKAIAALKRLAVPEVTVVRDGRAQDLAARLLASDEK